jgi:hypothetical protein
MVGPEAPKSIYDDGDADDDDDEVVDRAAFLQPKRSAAPLGDVPGTGESPFSALSAPGRFSTLILAGGL